MEFRAGHHPQLQLHEHRTNPTPLPLPPPPPPPPPQPPSLPRRRKMKTVPKTTRAKAPYWRRPERPMPRFFRVHPDDFRSVVHQLTGAPTRDTAPQQPLTCILPPRPPPIEIFPHSMPPPPPPPPALVMNLVYAGDGPVNYQGQGAMLNSCSTGDGGAARMLAPSLDAADYFAW